VATQLSRRQAARHSAGFVQGSWRLKPSLGCACLVCRPCGNLRRLSFACTCRANVQATPAAVCSRRPHNGSGPYGYSGVSAPWLQWSVMVTVKCHDYSEVSAPHNGSGPWLQWGVSSGSRAVSAAVGPRLTYECTFLFWTGMDRKSSCSMLRVNPFVPRQHTYSLTFVTCWALQEQCTWCVIQLKAGCSFDSRTLVSD